MTQPRRVSVLVGLLLLLSAATACAECAWVLWLNNPAGTDSWSREDAFDTRRACVKTLDANQKHYGKDRIKRASDTILAIDGEKGEAFRLDCLPDTVDPRGPKSR